MNVTPITHIEYYYKVVKEEVEGKLFAGQPHRRLEIWICDLLVESVSPSCTNTDVLSTVFLDITCKVLEHISHMRG